EYLSLLEEAEGDNIRGVFGKGKLFLLQVQVPQLDRSVRRTRTDAPGIGGEGQRLDSAGMTAQRGHFLAGRHVPKLDRLVLAACVERLAIRTEGEGENGIAVAAQRDQFLAAGHLPQFGVAAADGGKQLAVGAEDGKAKSAGLAAQPQALPAVANVPELDQPI